jgi:hypothetical protein
VQNTALSKDAPEQHVFFECSAFSSSAGFRVCPAGIWVIWAESEKASLNRWKSEPLAGPSWSGAGRAHGRLGGAGHVTFPCTKYAVP